MSCVQFDGSHTWCRKKRQFTGYKLIKKFFKEELDKNSVIAFFATTATDGKNYQVEYFNLDAIISVGYRVNSKRRSLTYYFLCGFCRKTSIYSKTMVKQKSMTMPWWHWYYLWCKAIPQKKT